MKNENPYKHMRTKSLFALLNKLLGKQENFSESIPQIKDVLESRGFAMDEYIENYELLNNRF